MKRTFGLLLLFITLSSHELFLKSTSYFLAEKSENELFLYNGTFDESENIITRDRIINPKILGPGYSFTPSADDYYDKGDVTYLKFKTGNEGTYIAGISTKSRIIELTGDEFTEYLEHEGLSTIIKEREEKGISDNTANERYSKHVKAILQVGDTRSDHYATQFNYPIEFIPLQNPYELTTGDEITFRLLYMGKPLGNQQVHISSREKPNKKEAQETALKTNEKGEVSFKITNPGQWYIATIHMKEVDEDDLDYESNWATLTFEIK